ncbi:MAG TPA: DedA family protein, partial [Candidatus Dormibacteraeota bacterium]|nr:DedA family protein [Candidatus Dormibacteraeota bacterium]
MLSHLDPRAIAEALGYPAAAIGILIESTGIPFPGETMLIAAAAIAAVGHLDIRVVILFGALGSTLGADIGYLIGRLGGRPVVERFGRFVHISPARLTRAEMFFHFHGDKAVLAGRFVLGVRTWGSVLAGMSRMPFWRFQAFSAIGAVLWASVMGTLGFELGHNW